MNLPDLGSDLPSVVLRTYDGDQNSGSALVQFNLNNTGWQNYTAPFTVAEGVNTVQYRATDAAGLTSAVQSPGPKHWL